MFLLVTGNICCTTFYFHKAVLMLCLQERAIDTGYRDISLTFQVLS